MDNLIYDKNIIDFSTYTNLMLIDAQIYNSDLFYSSANSNTFAIKYNKVIKINFNNPNQINTENLENLQETIKSPTIIDISQIYNLDDDFDINYNMADVKNAFENNKNNIDMINYQKDVIGDEKIVDQELKIKIDHTVEYHNNLTQKEELIKLLQINNFTNLKRICIVCEDTHINDYKEFLDSEPFFTQEDLLPEQQNYSENLQFIINLCEDLEITNIDYLVCNSLKHENWIKYYNIISNNTRVIIGASTDQTGNFEAGGDWIMENTNENIKSIYFTDLISTYKSTLIASNSINNSFSNTIYPLTNMINLFTNITTCYLLKTFVGKETKFTLRENDASMLDFNYKILKYPKKGKIKKLDKKNGRIIYLASDEPGEFYIKYTCVYHHYKVSSNYKIKIIVSNKKKD